MVQLRLDGVSRVHADGTRALSDLTLHVADGEILVLTGPSGSGKSTTLRVVAGLEEADSGTIEIDGEIMNDVPPRERDVAMIFQQHALYPHMTVEGNLRFPLEVRGMSRVETDQRVAAESRVLRLRRLLGRLPATLSAGHRQLAALGRATARAPRVFLMDEPLSSLDAQERVRLRAELRRYLSGLGTTTLYVTNDQTEAAVLGDRIAVLDKGRLRQVGTLADLLERPADTFVAGFFGTPPTSFVSARVEESAGLGWYVLAGQRLRIPAGLPGPLRARAGRPVLLAVRPHQVHDAGAVPAASADARLVGPVRRVERLGSEDLVFVAAGPDVLCARFAAGSAPRPGDEAEVALDVAELQAFDPSTGDAVWYGRSPV